MAVSYPDIIGDFLLAPQRYNANGLQFAGYFEPATITPGEVSSLYLFLQNCLNVPIEAQFQVTVPKTGGFFRKKNPVLAVETPQISLELSAGEAGLLLLPVTTTEHVTNGTHQLGIGVKVSAKGRGKRIRPAKSKSNLGDELIDSPVGLNLVGSLGATYTEKSVNKVTFPLTVKGEPNVLQRAPKLKFEYETIWTEENIKRFNQAVQELNSRQVKLKDELDVEKLFVNFYGEGVSRFADVGLPLRIGEAITLAKILTYSCYYFLSDPQRRDGLLVPIWERAFEAGADTTDALNVLRTVGFHHIIRLSVAISFGLLSKVSKQEGWSQEERQAVGNHIADQIETGQPLELEFLYLPLLLAGTQISSKVKLQGEEVEHSLALMKKARDARPDLFLDDDMAKANQLYNRILKKALA